MVLANFSKALDTVCFKTVIKMISPLGFSKDFLVWKTSYLFERIHFVQIDDSRKSSSALAEFGIPQLHKVPFFNPFVADLQDCFLPTAHYADNATIYTGFSVPQIPAQVSTSNESLSNLCT